MPLDRDRVREAARAAVRELARRPVQDDQCIVSSGLIDSLSVLKLILSLETKLHVRIPTEQVQPEDFDSVEVILDTFERLGL